MATSRILRVRRADDASAPHILLNVTQHGSRPLDLKLIATEHEHLYHGGIKEANVKSLQASNYNGGLEEWKATLKYVLLQQSNAENASSEALQGLETIAAISGNAVTVTLRKNIGGITQRLGTIKLDEDDQREEVAFPEWVDTAVANSDELRLGLATLQTSMSAQQEQVAKLNAQLDDLVKAKKEHEDELLKKFAALLNAKKLKIRDQQRLLAGAKVDPAAAEEVGAAREGGGRSRKADGSRGGKRKDHGVADEEDDDEEMKDDAASAEEVDQPDGLEQTPPPSDRDHATEDEGDDGFDHLPAPSQPKSRRGARQASRTAKSSEKAAEHPAELPPRRELPFAKNAQSIPTEASKAPSSKPADIVDEDDETDDEL